MANRVKFGVSAVPIETLTDANGITYDILASEINVSLCGNGDSVGINAYNGTAASQGYLNATVNYVDAVHTAGGTAIGVGDGFDFVFIKNTGYRFSSATVLGGASTDCIIVAILVESYLVGGRGGYITNGDVAVAHFFELAFLQPGQAIILPLGIKNKSVTQFGSNANDITKLGDGAGTQFETSKICVKTVQSDGTASTDGNAVEYLMVD